MSDAARRRTTAIEFAAVTLIWGSTWIVIKGQLGVVPPVWSVGYRFLIGAVALIVFAVVTRRWRWPTPAGHAFAAVAGAMQFALNFNLVYAAEARLASGIVALIFALLIVPNTVLAVIFLGKKLTFRFVLGATIGIAGLVLLFGRDVASPGSAAATGVAFVIVAVLCASVGNVLQASALGQRLPPLSTLATMMAYGAVFDMAYAAATVGPPVFDPRPEYWAGLAYLAIAASVVAFTLYYGLIRRIGPGAAAYVNVLTPIVALFLSALFEGYHLTLLAAGGAALALFGLAIALSGRSGSPAGQPESRGTPAPAQTPAAP